MENRIDLAVEMAGLDALDEVVLVEVIDDVAADQIPELVGFGQIVDGDDVLTPRSLSALTMLEPMKPAAPVTTMYMVVPYSAAASSSRVTTAVPSLPTTMPAATLAVRIASAQPAPAATMTASVAITVSPAPETSKTSRACAGW
jgi:hypothetical protein